MGKKELEELEIQSPKEIKPFGYPEFWDIFSKMDAKSVITYSKDLMSSPKGRKKLGSFLIKGLCDKYNGDYNPHYLTGLGSSLFMVERYWNKPPIVENALYQYLDFFFDGIRASS